MQLIITLSPLPLVDAVGVKGFNALQDDLDRVASPTWSSTEPSPPLIVLWSLEGADLRRRILDGIDLGACWMASVDLREASLVGAKIGASPFADFRKGNLRDASVCEITGCRFDGAVLDGLRTAEASYDPSCPPTGLGEILARCQAEPDLPTDPISVKPMARFEGVVELFGERGDRRRTRRRKASRLCSSTWAVASSTIPASRGRRQRPSGRR